MRNSMVLEALPLALLIAAVSPVCAQTGSAATFPRKPRTYQPVAGDDWSQYATKNDLRATGYFWWFRGEDVHEFVDLVPDRKYGQVVRITFKASTETGYAPKIKADLPVPLEDFWFRWRMRYSPGWTTVGTAPPGYANSYKIAFWLWDGHEGRGEVQLSNTDEYIVGAGVAGAGGYIHHEKRLLPGSAPNFGRITTEWNGYEWWEFVVHYQKTGASTALQQWWRRRLTAPQDPFPGPWTYSGVELSDFPAPRVRGIILGANRNKNTPATMHIYWGPWEVVDGSRYPDPFKLAYFAATGADRSFPH